MNYYLTEKEKVIEALSSKIDGLGSNDAASRLDKQGKNKLKEEKKTPLFVRFLKQLTDPMIIVLIAAAVVSLITAIYANESLSDVIIIAAVVIINAVLGVYQESKAEKAIEALQKMSAAKSKVLRDEKLVIVKSEDIVVGDVVLLEAGDAVPADARIIESASLKAEESALTGESVPVEKTDGVIEKENVPLGDRKNMVYMGSTIVYGRAKVIVTATGMDTEMGKIADALLKAKEGQTPLQKKLSQLSKILSFIVIGICAVIFGVGLLSSGSFEFNNIVDTFMVAVSLAVAAIPEGLSTVVTIVLSMGVTSMSKQNAIIRRLTAVETLGCAQIICSDKTGTLTQNRMTVVDSFAQNESELCISMALCSDAEVDENGTATGEPTECALVEFAFKSGHNKNNLKTDFKRVAEIPFDSQRKLMSTVHTFGDTFVQYTKGAPDVVLERCTNIERDGKIIPLTEEIKKEIISKNKEMADKALRVLAAAKRNYEVLPENLTTEENENGLIFVGLTGMIDPVREEVITAIAECRTAGIRPIMITGDHKDTAVAIAGQLGILSDSSEAITGAELDLMSDEEFEANIARFSVYARVQPEHKTKIVNAWKKYGYVTAMTGDGVNDAPSIKSADIGIGMGITGTDVTKNVADMVLADDNFATIVGAVKEGRRIYNNIRKSIQFLLASNLSEVITIFTATLLGFVILKPVHILWINLITDCFPALALGIEKSESDIMKKKPRDSKEGIFAKGLGTDVIYQGLMVTALTLIAFIMGHYFEQGDFRLSNSELGTTMAFITMSMAEVFHSINMRSQRKSIFSIKEHNPLLFLSMAVSGGLTILVVSVPFLREAFSFTNPGLYGFVISIGLALLVIPIVEIVKLIQRASKKDK